MESIGEKDKGVVLRSSVPVRGAILGVENIVGDSLFASVKVCRGVVVLSKLKGIIDRPEGSSELSGDEA